MKRLIFIIFIFILFLELVMRLYLFSKIPNEYKPHGFEKFKLFFSGGSYVCEFRGQKYLFHKPDNVFRIVVIGGSTTAGIHGDQETWPFKLNERLNRHGNSLKYEVINLGQCGAASAQEYYYLVTQRYLNPDLVILYDGYNDLCQSNGTSAAYILHSIKTYELLNRKMSPSVIASFLYRNSALVNRMDLYLYRMKNACNKLIIEKKWFGLGSQNRLRIFENVEWYASHLVINHKLENLNQIKLDVFQKKMESGELSLVEYNLVIEIVKQYKGDIGIDSFIEELSKRNISDTTKRHLLKILELDRLEFKIDKLKIDYDVFDITGHNREQDLLPEVYKYNLENIGAFLKAHHTKGIFIYQPFLTEKVARLNGGLDKYNLKGISNFSIEADKHFVNKNPNRKKIMEFVAERYGLLFFDAQSVFDKYENREVYLDICHNTDYGLDILVQNIENFLRKGKIIL